MVRSEIPGKPLPGPRNGSRARRAHTRYNIAQVTPSPARPLHQMAVARMAADALGRGATVKSPGILEWNVAGRCERPVSREVRGAPQERLAKKRRVDNRSKERYATVSARHQTWAKIMDGPHVRIDLTVKCRKCPTCLRQRALEWAHRASSEIRASGGRTWFGTLTIRPEQHVEFLNLARVREGKQFLDLEELPADEQYRLVEAVIYREVQLMLKRLRKAGHKFRFIGVCESAADHQSGLPHYHMLVHEIGNPIKYRDLATTWPHGFTKWKLVDDGKRAAWYVCKYLTKDARIRIRASIRYGREPDLTPSRDNQSTENFFDPSKKLSVVNTTDVNSTSLTQEREPDSPGPDECPPF